MKRALLVACASAVMVGLPATAQAGTLRGVVIAKDAQRRAVVTVSSAGVVRTLRSRRAFRVARIGQSVLVRAAALPDGTFTARGIAVRGRTARVRFAASVVGRSPGSLVVSAGHSTFSVRLRGAATASLSTGGGLEPGDRVDVDGDVSAGALDAGADDVHDVGHAEKLEVEGIYLSRTAAVLQLAVVHRGLVHVRIPDGLEIPALKPGDEVSLLVTVETDGSFTLLRAENENASNGDGGDGVDINAHSGEFTVVGIYAGAAGGSVAVKVEGHPEAVRCAVAAGAELPRLTVGVLVELHCRFADGRPTLVSLKSREAPGPEDGKTQFTVTGTIVGLSSDGVAVSVAGHDRPAVCARPAGMDFLGFAIGDAVELSCRLDGGRFLVVSLKSSAAEIPATGPSTLAFEGVVVEISPARISLAVEHHPSPVTCAVPLGVDVRGFAAGDTLTMHCRNDGTGFRVTSLVSAHASWPENGTPSFTLHGVLQSIGTDSVGVQVAGHADLVRCVMPLGTSLSGFALGDAVDLRCNFHDGHFALAELKSEYADLVLEA